MKNKTFKDLSRIIIFFVLLLISVCNSGEAQYDNSILEKLEARLSAYKDTFRSKDYARAASFVSPNMINKIGGEENFARLVRKFTDSTIIILKPSLVEFSKAEKIVPYSNMYISVIRQIIPITTKGIDEELKDAYLLFNPTFPATVFEGMDGVFKMSIIAYSEDEGNTWFFTGGNKMSFRQNKQWVRRESGKSEGLPEESIILTIGEQMEDSQTDMRRKGIPDDSLDAYIYLEEHPDELIEMPRELTKPDKENTIKKGYEKKQVPAKNVSHSVFATNNSRTYHQPDCPELGTGNLLEFDSAEEALNSGGVPCEDCNH